MSLTQFLKKINKLRKSSERPNWRFHKKLKISNTEEIKFALETLNIEFSDQEPFRGHIIKPVDLG